MDADFSVASSQDIVLEITALQGRILDLRSQLNARAPISRFPADVVMEIFSWLQQLYANIFASKFDSKSFVKWTRVTHVSQNWRRIALSSRKLWSIIPARRVRYSMVAIERSGSSPIFVTTLDSFIAFIPDDKALWQQILASSHRIRLLRLGMQSYARDFDQPLPLLEDLSIDSGYTTKCVPQVLFPASLTHLQLHSVDFKWDHFRFDKLAKLNVIDPVHKIPLDAFLLLLKNMPRLVNLEIRSIFPELDSHAQIPALCDLIGSPLPPPSLDLPILTSYHASGSTSPAYIQLLALLRLQPKFRLSLALKPRRYKPRDIVYILEILNRAIKGSSHIVRAVKCSSGNSGQAISYIFSGNPRLKTGFLSFSIELTMTNIDLAPWLEALMYFPLDNVEFLSTDGVSASRSWVNNIFPVLQNLRSLQILEHGDALLEYLISDSYYDYISFQGLEELEIHDLHFTRELKVSVPSCLLRRRNKAYTRLRKLTFVGCKVTDAAMNKLEGRVDVVRRLSNDEYLTELRRR